MTLSPPGTRLHRLLLRCAPVMIVRDVIEPAIADLRYEAEHAASMGERCHVIVRGHVAIVWALLISLEPGGLIRAVLALSALCALGTLLVTTARAAHVDGRVLFSAIVAPGMLAPVVLRLLGTTSSLRVLLGSLLVAILAPAFAGTLAPDGGGPLWASVGRVLVRLTVLAPLAAAVAIGTARSPVTSSRHAVTAVLLGSGIATAALLVVRWPQGEPLTIGLAMTPFYVSLFTALFSVTLLPLLFVARAFVARQVLSAVAGLICSPAPVIAAAYIDHGTLTACLDALRHTPLSFAASSLPFVAGAIAIGWHFPSYGQPPDPSLRDS